MPRCITIFACWAVRRSCGSTGWVAWLPRFRGLDAHPSCEGRKPPRLGALRHCFVLTNGAGEWPG
jgi:hypothetical protein